MYRVPSHLTTHPLGSVRSQQVQPQRPIQQASPYEVDTTVPALGPLQCGQDYFATYLQ